MIRRPMQHLCRRMPSYWRGRPVPPTPTPGTTSPRSTGTSWRCPPPPGVARAGFTRCPHQRPRVANRCGPLPWSRNQIGH